jgi:hypothetical protein
MDAILYIRFSTADQVDGDSIERQTRLGKKMERQHGLNIVEQHIDHGKSAFHGRNRSAGGKLFELEERAKRGELAGKAIIFEAFDRLSRQEVWESLDLVRDLTRAGVSLVESSSGTVYDKQKLNEDWTRIVVILSSAATAHKGSADKSRLGSSAWRRTQTTLRTKDGKADPRMCPAWMEVIDGEFTPIEERADVIRGIFQKSADGYGLRSIAKWAQGERERLGWPKQVWHIRTVTNMLHDRRVIGEYQPMTRLADGGRAPAGEPVQAYPGVVSLELWHQVMAGLDARKGTGGPRQKTANVLSNLCRCTNRAPGSNVPCGSRMTLSRQKRGPAQIVCSDFARAGLCTCNANYRYDDILRGVLDNLLTLAMPAPVDESAANSLAVMRAELAAKQQRLDDMADKLMEQDDDTLERAYQRFKAKVEADAQELRTREQKQEKRTHASDPQEIAARALALRDSMADDADARIKVQSYLDQLIDVILMDPEDRSATVVVMGGLLVLKLDRRGNVVGKVSTTHMLNDQKITDKLGRDVVFEANADRIKHLMAGDQPTALTKLEKVVEASRDAA